MNPAASPTMRALPEHERPRERLLAGRDGLKDEELIAILLGSGGRGISAIGLAQRLLVRFRTVRGLAAASLAELRQEKHIGPAKAARLRAGLMLARRLAEEPIRPGQKLPEPESVYLHFWPRLRDRRQEVFLALLLDGKNRVIREETISEGTLTASLVHPREAFRPAVREAANGVLFVHNHPSGDPAPSDEDRLVTRRLVEAGKLIDIRVLDHVIVAESGYVSFADRGWL